MVIGGPVKAMQHANGWLTTSHTRMSHRNIKIMILWISQFNIEFRQMLMIS